ncbi:hypothetical protein AB0N14_12805 [Streptomyces sp. NPDC051104]|uniref:hypothetical protein n=1 Tax=Streptomyces sp. NPDC051104 TaxID=3155044 RepID=UPI00341BAEF7
MLNAFGAASADLPSDVRVVLLRDAGRAFSADHDLNWSAEEHAKGMKTQAALAAATECLHAITRQIRA